MEIAVNDTSTIITGRRWWVREAKKNMSMEGGDGSREEGREGREK
jgi:hypothetical protein